MIHRRAKIFTGLVGLWGSLFLIVAGPNLARAGLGYADSPAALLDTRAPELNLDPINANLTLHAGEHYFFHWTSSDQNPSADTADYQAAVTIASLVDSSLSWYPDITDFTWDWLVPEAQSAQCRLEVSVRDVMGNTTSAVSNFFTVLYSTTDVPLLPEQLHLAQPVPNPFNPSCRISFNLPETGQITLAVHDLRGRRVRLLESGVKSAGNYTLTWDGHDETGRPMPGGLYFFALDAPGFEGRQKLTRRALLIP